MTPFVTRRVYGRDALFSTVRFPERDALGRMAHKCRSFGSNLASAGVYTIWDRDGRFIYVGTSGKAAPRKTTWGLFTRLQSH